MVLVGNIMTPRGIKEEISNFMASDSFIQIFYYTIKHLSDNLPIFLH